MSEKKSPNKKAATSKVAAKKKSTPKKSTPKKAVPAKSVAKKAATKQEAAPAQASAKKKPGRPKSTTPKKVAPAKKVVTTSKPQASVTMTTLAVPTGIELSPSTSTTSATGSFADSVTMSLSWKQAPKKLSKWQRFKNFFKPSKKKARKR